MVIFKKAGQSLSEFLVILGILTILGGILAYICSPKKGGVAVSAQQNTATKIAQD
jgi:uncharacterized protein (UPF0333 family)